MRSGSSSKECHNLFMPPDEENSSDYGIKNIVLKYEH